MLESKKVWPRGEHWKSLPGQGPVWSQKSDAILAIKYAILNGGQGAGIEQWCDAIIFGQDQINIWINGTQITLTAKRPVQQRTVPFRYAPVGGSDATEGIQETDAHGGSSETPSTDVCGMAGG